MSENKASVSEKSSLKMKNTRLGVICFVLCLCLAVTCAEESHRVKRITCGGIMEDWFGSGACSAHCRVIGRSSGSCSGGTCYCSGRASQQLMQDIGEIAV